MKNLKRNYPTYKLNKLPELVNHNFSHGKNIGYTGSIFRRRLVGLKGKVFWHYAFFLGITRDKECLFIENNQDGVEAVNWHDFALDFTDWELTHLEISLDRFQEILARAKEKAKDGYKGGENNCEHFVNYCVFGNHKSVQADNVKLFADLVFTLFEVRIMMIPDVKYYKLLDSVDDLRNILEVRRNEEQVKIIGRQSPPKEDFKTPKFNQD